MRAWAAIPLRRGPSGSLGEPASAFGRGPGNVSRTALARRRGVGLNAPATPLPTGDLAMPRLPLLAVLALTGLPLAAQAAPRGIDLHARTAGELAALCGANPREPGADAKINYCHGFAQGALDVELHYAGAKRPFCFPNPMPTRTATLNEFVNWVRAQPEHARLGAAPGLFRFLGERFPCK